MLVYIRRAVENGKPIFPEKFVLTDQERDERLAQGRKAESIEQLQRDLIPSEMAALYFNDPTSSDAIEFKPGWFQPIDTSKQNIHEGLTLLSLDPAFRLKQTNDFSGIVVSRVTPKGEIFILEAQQKKLNANDLISHVFELVQTYNVNKVVVETVAAQIVLLDLFRNKMQQSGKYFVLEEIKLDTSETKAMRIRSLIPFYANLKIWHMPGLKELEAQLIEFPRGLHDDMIDALAHSIPYWKAPHKIAAYDSMKPGTFAWWKKQARTAPRQERLFDDFGKPRRI